MMTRGDETPSADRPPMAVLVDMISGIWLARAVHVAAELGIADLLKDGPKQVGELAKATGTHERSLYRLLRALASYGVFAEVGDAQFALTPLAELLQTGPDTLRAYSIMLGQQWQSRTWEELLYSTKTSQSAFRHVFGAEMWEYFATHPPLGQIFDEAMTSFSATEIAGVTASYDFSPFSTLVDVGGGNGSLLAAILKRYPKLRGLLTELPSVIDDAKRLMETEGLADRCELVAGDCLEVVPAGGDAYMMKHIIHLFDDARAIAVLKNCHRAMAKTAKLLVIEMVIPPGNEPSYSKLLDLMMLVGPGGCDRTEAEYRTLFQAGGFKLTKMIPTESPASVIESVPA